MPTPEPSPRSRYQFGLRSLLLLTLFVAVLCSLGVCTHWFVSATIAMLALAGVAGRIVAGTGCGVLLGVTFRVDSLIVAGYGCLFLPFREPWLLCVVLGITALIGGILGGYSVRTRSGR